MPAKNERSGKMGSEAKDVIITRVFDAPRELVFKAFTDPKMLVQWFSPKGFTNPRAEFEGRPGGKIRIDMKGPDGALYPTQGTVNEIDPPSRMVWTTTAYADENGTNALLEVRQTFAFEDEMGKTRFTLSAHVVHAEGAGLEAQKGMEQGWVQTLDKLETLLRTGGTMTTTGMSSASTADREIVASRVFAAPRERVWHAWTTREEIEKWWGPNGFSTTTEIMDVRPGGEWNFYMHGPDGTDYRNEIVYVEVKKPERIVYDHGPSPKFRVTVDFKAEGNKTRLDFRMVFATAQERDNTVRTFGAVEGLNQTMGRLEQYLAQYS
jgi:uncharacterized protein YndB with AHSA1/START domain